MEHAAVIAFFFVATATADWVTLLWHRSREKRTSFPLWPISAVLEALSWAPVLAAVSYGGMLAWACAASSCAGASVGTWKGTKRHEQG